MVSVFSWPWTGREETYQSMWTVLNIVFVGCSLTCLLSLPLSQYWSMFTIHPNEQQTSTEDYLLVVLLQTCTTQPNKWTLLLFYALGGTDVVGILWSLSGHGAPTQADNHGLSTIQLLHYPAPLLVICRLILSVCMQYVSYQVVTIFTSIHTQTLQNRSDYANESEL